MFDRDGESVAAFFRLCEEYVALSDAVLNPDKPGSLQFGSTAVGVPLLIPGKAQARVLGVWFTPLGVSYTTFGLP